MSAALRVGVLGCASIARRRMLPALAAAPGVTLAAVAGRDPARTAEVAARHGCRAAGSYASLLDADLLDAVYVPLPAALHARWVGAALGAGLHVLAEKPLTTDPARTAALLDAAARRGLALVENVFFPHHPQLAAVRAALAEGRIGRVRSFSAVFAVPAPPPRDIRWDPALGGGALFDTGVYPVRAAVELLGAGLAVESAALRTGPSGVDVAGTALLRAADGVPAHLEFGIDARYRSGYRVRGTHGTLTVRHAFTPPADHVPDVVLHRAGRRERLPVPAADQVARTVAAFARAAATGARPGAAQTLQQAELLAGIRRAAAGARAPRARRVAERSKA